LDTLQVANRPLVAEELISRVTARLGSDCWGNSPRRALHDDIQRLKESGCTIHYKRGQHPGYLWGGPNGPVDPEAVRQRIEPADKAYAQAVAGLTPREKLARADAMARWGQALRMQTRGASE
jgi:hypothetical protein